MTTYALGALYVPHSEYLMQLSDLVSDFRACFICNCGAMYAYLLTFNASIPDIKDSICQLGLFLGECRRKRKNGHGV